jgi:hypothetical protein
MDNVQNCDRYTGISWQISGFPSFYVFQEIYKRYHKETESSPFDPTLNQLHLLLEFQWSMRPEDINLQSNTVIYQNDKTNEVYLIISVTTLASLCHPLPRRDIQLFRLAP